MQINNNYAISQPNFGKLKSIKTKGDFNVVDYPYLLDTIKAFKESNAMTKFCNNYDCKAIFYLEPLDGTFRTSASLTLQTKEKASGFWEKICNFFKKPVNVQIFSREDTRFRSQAAEALNSRIQEMKYSTLEANYNKLKNGSTSIKREYDELINSLLNE